MFVFYNNFFINHSLPMGVFYVLAILVLVLFVSFISFMFYVYPIMVTFNELKNYIQKRLGIYHFKTSSELFNFRSVGGTEFGT